VNFSVCNESKLKHGCVHCFSSDEIFSFECHCLGCLLSKIIIYNQIIQILITTVQPFDHKIISSIKVETAVDNSFTISRFS
jgi:hypothetical protein